MIAQEILAFLVWVWILVGLLNNNNMDDLMKECDKVLGEVSVLLDKLSPYKDYQFVLDFCDKLNNLSITY